MKQKILKLYNKLPPEKQKESYKWWKMALDAMMDVGMFYFADINTKLYRNIIDKEIRCFLNLIEILRLVDGNQYVGACIKRDNLKKYIRYCIANENLLDLSRLDLSNIF